MLQTPNLLAGTANGHDSNPLPPQDPIQTIFQASANTTRALLKQLGLDTKKLTEQCGLIHRNTSPSIRTGEEFLTSSKQSQENRLLERIIVLTKYFKKITAITRNSTVEINQDFLYKDIENYLKHINQIFPEKIANELLEILLAVIKKQCTNNSWMKLSDPNGNNLAHLFAYHGNSSGLKFLEYYGVSTQQANFYMSKPIHLALHHQDSSVLKHLLKFYSDDTEDTGLPNLFDYAAWNHQKNSAFLLGQYKFTPSRRSINETTNFLGIVLSGYAEKIGGSGRENHKLWAQKVGGDCTQYLRNEYKTYLTLRKARYITKTFDQFLIDQHPRLFTNKRGVFYNIEKFAKDNFGRTPLHYAAMNPNPAVYATLRTTLQAHPDLWKKLQAQVDNVGYTAQDYFLATHHIQNTS